MQHVVLSEGRRFILDLKYKNKISFTSDNGLDSTVELSNFEFDLLHLLISSSSSSTPLSISDIEDNLSNYTISLFTIKNSVSSLRSKLRSITKTSVSHKFIHNVNRKGYYINSQKISDLNYSNITTSSIPEAEINKHTLFIYVRIFIATAFSKSNLIVTLSILVSIFIFILLSTTHIRYTTISQIDDIHKELQTLEIAFENNFLTDINCEKIETMLHDIYNKDKYLISSKHINITLEPNKTCLIEPSNSPLDLDVVFDSYEFWFLETNSYTKVYIGMRDIPNGSNISRINIDSLSNFVLNTLTNLSLNNINSKEKIEIVDKNIDHTLTFNFTEHKGISLILSPSITLVFLVALAPTYLPIFIIFMLIIYSSFNKCKLGIRVVEHVDQSSHISQGLIIQPYTTPISKSKLSYTFILLQTICQTKFNYFGNRIFAFNLTSIDFSSIPYILRLAIFSLLKNSRIIVNTTTYLRYSRNLSKSKRTIINITNISKNDLYITQANHLEIDFMIDRHIFDHHSFSIEGQQAKFGDYLNIDKDRVLSYTTGIPKIDRKLAKHQIATLTIISESLFNRFSNNLRV